MTILYTVALYFLLYIPCSHPLEHVGLQSEVNLLPRIQERYEDETGVLVNLPKQPNRAARIELSLILESLSFSKEVNDILIRCMSSNTGTKESNWGAFGVDRFTPLQVQVQYFCIVSEKQSLEFPEMLDTYLSSGKLLRCIQNADEGIPEGADVISGRNVAAPRSGSIVSATGSTPGWAAGVALAVFAAIGFLALIAVLLQGEDVYLESDFAEFEKKFLGKRDSKIDIDSRTTPNDDEREAEIIADDSENECNSKTIPSDSEGEGESAAVTSDSEDGEESKTIAS
ncbi:hypothetical protein FGB62_19g291 [Gracilaria domingensis]|nr:hypothetical protein FGB62_19g291 [Gracilaria domingensis]